MPRSVRAPLLAALGCAAALAPVAVVAYSFGPAQRLDYRLIIDLHRGSGAVYAVAEVLVHFGSLVPMLLMLAAVCAIGLRSGRRREVLAAVVIVAGANVTTQLLKSVLEHVRNRTLEHGFELPWPNAFPSGHTTAAASIAVALLIVVPATHRRLAAAVGAGLIAAVGCSVVILGWHYPSDVLGAVLVVAAWGFAGLAWLRFRADRDRATAPHGASRRGHLAVSTD